MGGVADETNRSDPFEIAGRLFDNRYQVAKKIGEGGMALVYRARDTATGEDVALKILLPLFVEDVIAMKRLRREAELGVKLTHKNLCAITRMGETDGRVYVVMPFLEGESLAARRWKAGQLSLATTADIVRDMSNGLHVAHELGVIHRDLKPENVMIVPNPDGTERAVVLDFGLATEARDGDKRTKLTSAGTVVGTPEFMSPEQMRGRDLDRRSDVYSLAFMTSELLTGQLPFGGKTIHQMAMARMRGELIPLRQQRPDLDFPAAVERVLAKALAVDPAARYPTALDFGTAFGRAANPGSFQRILGWFGQR